MKNALANDMMYWPNGLMDAAAPPRQASLNPSGSPTAMNAQLADALRKTKSLTAQPGNTSDSPMLIRHPQPVPLGTVPDMTMPWRTVSGRLPYRSHEGPADRPSTYPPQPNRRAWSPQRSTISGIAQDMQKTRNVLRNSLGFDARINENLTMHIPDPVLPAHLRSTAVTRRKG